MDLWIASEKWTFLLLAAAIFLFASFTMYHLIGYLEQAGASRKRYWLLSGAAVYGVGLWVSNFILLLASDDMVIIDWTSIVKLAGAAGCSFASFKLLGSRASQPLRVMGASLLITAGCGVMIYCTLLSGETQRYAIDPVLACAAFIVGLAGTACSFYFVTRKGGPLTLLAAALLGLSGIGMQLFGLSSAAIVYNTVLTSDRLDDYMRMLSVVLGLATLAIFAFSLLARSVDRRYSAVGERYKLLVENSIDMIAIVQDGRWTYVNRSGLAMFEADSAEDLVGRTVFLYLQPKFHSLMQEILSNGEDSQLGPLEMDWYTVKGKTLHTEMVKTFTRMSGKPGFQVIVRDISERKKNEELLINSEKLYVAGQLAAGIAHEIRNPLTSLKGFLQLMASGRLGGKNYFDIMKSELTRIESIVSELLMLSKPQIYELSYKDIRAVLGDTVTLLEAQAILHNIELEPLPGGAPLWVKGVENQLKQVFINVLKNAIEAMADGGKIVIACRREGPSVVVCIQDSGPGIPEDQLAKIGQPFYTTKEKGTGLGLMVSYKIVDNHKGRIRAFSSLGVGTTFEISLPYEEPPAEPTLEWSAAAKASSIRWGRMRELEAKD
ncbi:ATP-binding protein [Paenibacillus humicola]|uniref:ATP-binding protein n=1 Tax=Paenibacillus humicola TaxID=3110540 RepID=UPI00237A73AF|nr:ATP-binding protein [Paenibacillus humicola]